MGREIKFRIWNPSGNNILYDIDNVFKCLEQQLSFDKTMPNRGFTLPYNHKGEGMVWMQFTGLKDKNEKEIFEGDILNVGDKIVQVVWHKYAGQWDTDFIRYEGEQSSNGILNTEWKYRATVIGNIFETPNP